jgi:hypothetical protein
MQRHVRLLPHSGRAVGVELGQEPVDGAAATDLVLERFADDPAGQFDRVAAHLGTQLGDDLGTLRLQLRLALCDDAPGLLLGFGLQLFPDLLGIEPGVIADLGRLGAGLGELRAVLLEGALGLGLARSAFSIPPSIFSVRSA